MKKYSSPCSVAPGRSLGVVPALAGAVGVLAGKAAVGLVGGVAAAGGAALGRQLFGDDRRSLIIRNNSLKILKSEG